MVVAGLVGLFFGGDWLVRGAVALSARLGLPAFLISLTVVGFGTSMPELLVSVRAALADAPGIAIGNVVGSNIANILLIVGVAALIAPIRPATIKPRRDLLVMLASTAVLAAMLQTGVINLPLGAVMICGLLAYLTMAYFQDRSISGSDVGPAISLESHGKIAFLIIGGLALLALGADFLVRGATIVATDFGVSNAVIGLTVVAVGTSLPELATSITAALKKQSDIAIGNVIGSNIFNILGILGITAVIAQIPIADRFRDIDGWIMLATTALLFMSLWLGKTLGRVWGAVFLAAYGAYMVTMA